MDLRKRGGVVSNLYLPLSNREKRRTSCGELGEEPDLEISVAVPDQTVPIADAPVVGREEDVTPRAKLHEQVGQAQCMFRRNANLVVAV